MENIFQTPIERACLSVGGQASLAKILKVTPAVVNQWVKGIRPIPAIHCPTIEIASGGVVTRKELRPKDWNLIWPELASSPPNQPMQQQ